MTKTLLSTFSLFAALATVFLFTANTAEARSYSKGTTTYISHYTSCGHPVYVKKVFRYNDRYGRPVYSYYTQPVNYRSSRNSTHNSRHYQSSSQRYSNSSNYRSSRGYTSTRYSSNRGCSSRSGFSITYRR